MLLRLKLWAGAAFAVLFGVAAIFFAGKREGAQNVKARNLKQSVKKQEAGREAVEDLRGADRDDLVDQLRRNDGRWD